MTDAQIESAARLLCHLRGLNPEFWWPAALEIRSRLQVDAAILQTLTPSD